MQNIIVEKPYEFVPPDRGTFWSSVIKRFNLHGLYLKRHDGIVAYECRGVDKLRRSLDARHGILLTPNHCRTADPLVMGWLAREVPCHVFAMASWHLFNQGWFNRWSIRKMGGFSVNREGVDRKAINTAIEILDSAERPLIIFPEGAVSRTNDRLHALLDGIAFIARTAAKRRAKRDPSAKVVVHPVGIKYRYGGNLARVADEVLTEIESRLTWKPQRHLRLLDRILKVGEALLALKEIEHLGQTHNDSLATRMERLIDRLLVPLENEWLGGHQPGGVVPRVKALRMRMLPEMVRGELSEDERQRRWAQLADVYLAQQLSCYPPDYFEHVSVDRILETLERYEEDLTDKARVHGSMKAIIEVDDPIEVPATRDRRDPIDPLMVELERRLRHMLDRLALESPVWVDGAPRRSAAAAAPRPVEASPAEGS